MQAGGQRFDPAQLHHAIVPMLPRIESLRLSQAQGASPIVWRPRGAPAARERQVVFGRKKRFALSIWEKRLFCIHCEEKIDPNRWFGTPLSVSEKDGFAERKAGVAQGSLVVRGFWPLSDRRFGGCCLTAHPRIDLEKLVL